MDRDETAQCLIKFSIFENLFSDTLVYRKKTLKCVNADIDDQEAIVGELILRVKKLGEYWYRFR